MPEIKINREILSRFGLNVDDFENLRLNLGREPNYNELCLFSFVRTDKSIHTTFGQIIPSLFSADNNLADELTKPTPYVAINENLLGYMKIESNDLPSVWGDFLDSQNCLAGAGRKVISSGAKPVAVLNSFRFGLPQLESTKRIADEFLQGIGEIGNSLSYPVVGAKISFEKCFNDKPELNTFVVGIREKSNMSSAKADVDKHKIFILVNAIDCTSFINSQINSQEDINNIIGNPTLIKTSGLAENILHESIYEAMQTGGVASILPIGKDGLLTALGELCKQSGLGACIDFDRVFPETDFEHGMAALFSGYFASMVLLIDNQKESEIRQIFDKWDLKLRDIGKPIIEPRIVFGSSDSILAELPIKLTFDPIVATKKVWPSPTGVKIKSPEQEISEIPFPSNLKEVAWFLIKHPNIASKKWINEQYDSMAGVSNMSTNFTSDSVLINLKGTNHALAMCMTGNQKQLLGNPFIGAQIAIAAAVRKIVCTGARPLAVLPSISYLNANNTEDCAIFGQFVQGINLACKKLNLSISNENVKYYKQSESHQTQLVRCPSLTIGLLGLLENKNHQMTISFKNKGNIIFLIGPSVEDISGSEYLASYHQKNIETPPYFNLDLEVKIHLAIYELIKNSHICSAHHVSRGGLFIALVESAMLFGFGFDIITDTDIRLDAFLFGESQGRVLVSINPNKESNFIDFMIKKEIPFLALGHVTKGEMRIDDISFGFIEDAKKTYENALENLIT
jgi:phosphoribosylformylglycinamidine synthase subunit PurL